jgi:hypothetical protein
LAEDHAIRADTGALPAGLHCFRLATLTEFEARPKLGASIMIRSAGFVLAGLALWMVAACSGDAEGGDGDGGGSAQPPSGSGGSASGAAGTGGGSSAAPGSGAGGSSAGARYSARVACERFAEASCNKGLECGLVLTELLGQLVCVQCNAAALDIIVDRCVADGTTDKDAAAVDRCVANITAQPCADACINPDVDGCEVFGELQLGDNQIRCDERCAE